MDPSVRKQTASLRHALGEKMTAFTRLENYRDAYWQRRDPICRDRLLWQAQSFRHLTHLLPGERILEIGTGIGWFAEVIAKVSRGRNPITAAVCDPRLKTPAHLLQSIRRVSLESLLGSAERRQFHYVVAQNMVDRDNATFLLNRVYDRLVDGGQVVFFQSNPWNPIFTIRDYLRRLFRRPRPHVLVSQPQLYELLSDVGYVRISVRFTDFVYAPLTRTLVWLLRNLSILLENTPFVRVLAGGILIHAQKPPRIVKRHPVTLTGHVSLKGAVSVVIPCHNEEMNIRPLVEGLLGLYSDYIHEIVLVDDNSTDGTRAVIEESARADVRIIGIFRKPPNGVGFAIRDGLASASGKWVLSMDCDFQHLLPEVEDMFDAAAEGCDAVLGSRFSRHSVLINYPFAKILANRVFHLVFNLMFRRTVRDITNNLKLMQADAVRGLELTERWFAINAEIGIQLILDDWVTREVPISWINRDFEMGQSSFSLLRSAGGYLRVLLRAAHAYRLGFGTRRPLVPRTRMGRSGTDTGTD